MAKQRDQQQSLFDEVAQVNPLPPEGRTEIVTQLALMMLALIDGSKKEARDE